MDCKLKRDCITTQEILYDNSEEKPIDINLSLPDYCPDIQKILKCLVEPVINIRTVVGDRFETEGQLNVKVMYLDTDGMTLRICEKNVPFSSYVTLKKAPDAPVIFAKAKTEYINCRALSPRKLDIHGAFSIYARVTDTEKYEFVCGIENEGVEQKIQALKTSKLLSSSNQQFVVAEVLEIPNSKLPAESIIKYSTAAILEDYKKASDKIVVKGNVLLKTLYSSSVDNSQLETAEFSIPFSEVLDSEGLSEDSICDIRIYVADHQLQIRSDTSGENMLLDFESRISSIINIFEEAEIEAVIDAYSIDYETELEKKQLKLTKVSDALFEEFSRRFELDTGDSEILRIIDLWSENINLRTEIHESSADITGKMSICILSVDHGENLKYYERNLDIDLKKEFKNLSENAKCDTDVVVKNIEGKIAGNGKLEIRIDFLCYFKISCETGARAVFSAFIDESRKKEKRLKNSLVVYYADKGEKLWDIAEAYCTSVYAIKSENLLTYEILEDGEMILIPV